MRVHSSEPTANFSLFGIHPPFRTLDRPNLCAPASRPTLRKGSDKPLCFKRSTAVAACAVAVVVVIASLESGNHSTVPIASHQMLRQTERTS